MTPVFFPLKVDTTSDLKGKLFLSVTGSASISARSATTFPGRFPLIIPTTPVCATPVRTSTPSDFRCEVIYLAVLNSLLESSGF